MNESNIRRLQHDCAMHLSEDGFLRVIDRDFLWPPAPRAVQPKLLRSCDDRPWAELWEEFLRDASRWDSQMLAALFGSSDNIRQPSYDASVWDKNDRMLIGEFLRRHHSRLAHEIAVYGAPGPGEDRL